MLPLGGQRPQLVADVVALHVDEVDRVPGDLVLPLALVDGMLEVFQLLTQLPPLHRPGGQHQHHGAPQHREQVARLPQDVVVPQLEPVLPVHTQVGEIDVLHRAKDNRDAQRQNRHRQHLVIQLSPGYMPEQAP